MTSVACLLLMAVFAREGTGLIFSNEELVNILSNTAPNTDVRPAPNAFIVRNFTSGCSSNPCQQICVNGFLGAVCQCNPGFIVNPVNRTQCLALAPVCPSGFEASSLDPRTCQDINECERSRPCAQRCDNLNGTFRCSCDDESEVRTSNISLCDEINPCSSRLDIVFLLDSSVGRDNFEREIRFAARLANHFRFGNSRVRLAVVTYARDAETLFNLTMYNNRADAVEAIEDADFLEGPRNIRQALDFIRREELFSTSSGGRPNARDVVVAFLGGPAAQSVRRAASDLRAAGARILAVGVGDEVSRDELLDIASSTDDVIQAVSFLKINYQEQALSRRICPL